MVGGQFGIESAPGKGTTVTAQIQTGDGRMGRAKPGSTAPLKTLP
jgi:hypothetical protein